MFFVTDVSLADHVDCVSDLMTVGFFLSRCSLVTVNLKISVVIVSAKHHVFRWHTGGNVSCERCLLLWG